MFYIQCYLIPPLLIPQIYVQLFPGNFLIILENFNTLNGTTFQRYIFMMK